MVEKELDTWKRYFTQAQMVESFSRVVSKAELNENTGMGHQPLVK